MPLLSDDAIRKELERLKEWSLKNIEIIREYTFKDFPAAIRFVDALAEKAEAAGHHPDIDIRYNKVRLALTSHDAGGLTELDFELASIIDSLLQKTERSLQ